MTLNYNSFGQLADCATTVCPYTGIETTIIEVFEVLSDDLQLSASFNDSFVQRLSEEDIIDDMICFFDYIDSDVSEKARSMSPANAFDYLYDYAGDQEAEAKELLDQAEKTAISLFQEKMANLQVEEEIQDLLFHNFKNKGTASISYIEQIENRDFESAEATLERIENARSRHKETNYDELRATHGYKVARSMIY